MWPVLTVFVIASVLETAMVAAVLPFLSVIASPDTAVGTGRVAQMMDWLGVAPGYPTMMALGVFALAAIIIAGIGGIVRTYWLHAFSTHVAVVTSTRVLSAQLRQPYEFFLDHHSGELSNMVLTEAAQVMDHFFLPAANCISSLLTVIALVLLVCFVNPVIAVSSIIVLSGIYALSYLTSSKMITRMSTRRISANEDRSRTVIEAFGGIKQVKLSGHETGYVGRYTKASDRLADAITYTNVVSEAPRVIVQTTAFAGIILLCLIIISTQEDTATLSSLLPILGVFAFAGQRMLPALGQVYTNATRLKAGAAIVVRVAEELARPVTPVDGDGARDGTMALTQELRLEGVSFRYRTAAKPSLNNVSLSIRAGERIGIVGLTGAGKTTLVDLVLGLLQPQTGRITVDGVGLDAANRRSWQRSLGYVPQEIFLKEGTILENIAFGVPTDRIDRDRAMDCGRMARLEDFVNSLPAQWESEVGERGTRLSGGQKQRIGIARALYAKASLLVFDEATSALDGVTEAEVMHAVNSLDAGYTVLFIAHRLSTLRDCDRILLMEKGAVAGFEAWDTLYAQSDRFRRMVEAAGLSQGDGSGADKGAPPDPALAPDPIPLMKRG